MWWSLQIQILILTPLSNARHQIQYPVKPPPLQELSEVKGSYRTPGGFFEYSYTLPVSTIRPPPIPNCNRREPPSCVNGTQASFCVYDADYPMYEVKAIKHAWQLGRNALHPESTNITSFGLVEGLSKRREEFIFYSLYTGVSSGPTAYDATHWSGPEGFLCPSNVSYARVKRARNVEGEWRVIVQDPGSFTTQTTRLEECLYSDVACRALAPCYKSRCIQRYAYQRLISYDPCDPFKGLFLDIYKLPSACSCHVDKGHLKKNEGGIDVLEELYAEESQISHVVINARANAVVKDVGVTHIIWNQEKTNIAKVESESKLLHGGTLDVTPELMTAGKEDEMESEIMSELELIVNEEDRDVKKPALHSGEKGEAETEMEQESGEPLTCEENAEKGEITSENRLETAMKGQETAVKEEEELVKGEETAVEGEKTSMKGGEAAMKEQETAVRGEETTMKGQETPMEGEEAAIEGQETAAKGDEATMEGQETAVKLEAAAIEGQGAAVKEAEIKGQETVVDGEETALKGEEATTKGLGTAVKGEETSLKVEEKAVKGEGTELKGEVEMKGQETIMKKEEKAVTHKETAVKGVESEEERENKTELLVKAEETELEEKSRLISDLKPLVEESTDEEQGIRTGTKEEKNEEEPKLMPAGNGTTEGINDSDSDLKMELESESTLKGEESELRTESPVTEESAGDGEEMESELDTKEKENRETITEERTGETENVTGTTDSEVISYKVETQIELRELESVIEVEEMEAVTEDVSTETEITEIEAVTEDVSTATEITEIEVITENVSTETEITEIIEVEEESKDILITTEVPVTDGDCVS